MAAVKNQKFALIKEDILLGKKGTIINGDVYNILANSIKKKYLCIKGYDMPQEEEIGISEGYDPEEDYEAIVDHDDED